jgi:hypothetical protein
MADKPKSKVAEALAEKKKQLQALKDSKKAQTAAVTPAETSAAAGVCPRTHITTKLNSNFYIFNYITPFY